ncbi:peptide chain release factor N(5)-glutamine methyltransferase [Nocardioides marmorisolisilvae]|uniref:Release factor glutamine methyltransferase n=1 Tax=Nocardioides marmorisolisilvae TaxID=1542737 RepID=A0A3N0DWN9_9ACTN|nr:peptide chain release factor N(5)-glutamine methyltransferase [Nocardioides marmorisolisilvae]RNL80027.1 peptide chain release factor N(5)-glutamine methyltransferase [Nocardioides marmorisolisilvae]
MSLSKPGDLIADATTRLTAAGVPSPLNDAELLLAHVLGIGRGGLPLVGDVAADASAAYAALVERRAGREPLQHILGSAGFRYADIVVGPGVFTPRPETELLAGWAVEQAQALTDRTPVVVDLCTGSGAIALSVATEVPGARVHAVELDPGAVAWAERNLAGTGVELREGDMADAFTDLDGTVDVVVCNPPYIPLTEFEGVDEEARTHDPALALFSGEDGLEAMRVLERVAARLLRPGGVVGAEHADLQGETAPAVFSASGRWADVRDHRDLAGRPRYLTARLARTLSG